LCHPIKFIFSVQAILTALEVLSCERGPTYL